MYLRLDFIIGINKYNCVTGSILTTAVIWVHEENYEISSDVPNAFIQTDIPNGNKQAIKNIKGGLLDLLLETAHRIYGKYVVYENVKKVYLYWSAAGFIWNTCGISTVVRQVTQWSKRGWFWIKPLRPLCFQQNDELEATQYNVSRWWSFEFTYWLKGVLLVSEMA